jgi:hypothetical protein
MKIIDIFNHVMPPAYLELVKAHSKEPGMVKRMSNLRMLWGIEHRVAMLREQGCLRGLRRLQHVAQSIAKQGRGGRTIATGALPQKIFLRLGNLDRKRFGDHRNKSSLIPPDGNYTLQ